MNLTEMILEPIRIAWEIWPPLGVGMAVFLSAWFVGFGMWVTSTADEPSESHNLGGYHPKTGFRFDPDELEDANE